MIIYTRNVNEPFRLMQVLQMLKTEQDQKVLAPRASPQRCCDSCTRKCHPQFSLLCERCLLRQVVCLKEQVQPLHRCRFIKIRKFSTQYSTNSATYKVRSCHRSRPQQRRTQGLRRRHFHSLQRCSYCPRQLRLPEVARKPSHVGVTKEKTSKHLTSKFLKYFSDLQAFVSSTQALRS